MKNNEINVENLIDDIFGQGYYASSNEWLNNAKVCIIKNIMEIRKLIGHPPSEILFYRLMNMDLVALRMTEAEYEKHGYIYAFKNGMIRE